MTDTHPSSASRFACEGLLRMAQALPIEQRRFLGTQVAQRLAGVRTPRPWHYTELHNPWSRAAACVDSWGFLDLCRSAILLETVATLCGPDLILFDSQLLPARSRLPDPDAQLQCDAHRFPVEPLAGATALIALPHEGPPTLLSFEPLRGPRAATDAPQASLTLEAGDIVCLHPQLRYRLSFPDGDAAPRVYLARYFPATSRYLRDPAAPQHQRLTDRYPFVNYARLPLWLVRGCDRADNDFVTGFDTRAGYWTAASW